MVSTPKVLVKMLSNILSKRFFPRRKTIFTPDKSILKREVFFFPLLVLKRRMDNEEKKK